MIRYRDIATLEDIMIFLDEEKKCYEVGIEELLYFNSPDAVVRYFLNELESLKQEIDCYDMSDLPVFEHENETGKLSIGFLELLVNGEGLYSLVYSEAITGSTIHSVCNKVTEELLRLQRDENN